MSQEKMAVLLMVCVFVQGGVCECLHEFFIFRSLPFSLQHLPRGLLRPMPITTSMACSMRLRCCARTQEPRPASSLVPHIFRTYLTFLPLLSSVVAKSLWDPEFVRPPQVHVPVLPRGRWNRFLPMFFLLLLLLFELNLNRSLVVTALVSRLVVVVVFVHDDLVLLPLVHRRDSRG